MTDHDPLCRLNLSDCDHGNTRVCHCSLIARVRADERRIQHDGRECVCARTEADTEANLRERIAQEIEATGHAISCVTRYNGPLAPDVYECDCGLERHLRIARGGESDG